MHRALSSIQKLSSLAKFKTALMLSPMSGIKLRTSKKSSSTVFEELSSEYLQKYNQEQQKNISERKQTKQNKKGTGTVSYKREEQEVVQIQGLKNSWLGNALQDDLLVQTKQWEGENDAQNSSQQQQPQNSPQKLQSSAKQSSLLEQSKKLFPSKPAQQQNLHSLKVKSFKKQLSKTQLINNSRKFLEIICNIFPRHQVERIIAEMKQFCAKRDLNIPSLIGINLDDSKHAGQISKNQQRKVEKEMKIIQKITKDRQKKLFVGVRRIFDQSLTDLQLIDNLLSLLSNSDPYIMNNEDIHKLIYNHEEGIFDDEALHHKAEINVIMDKKQRKSLTQKQEQKTIDELIDAKKDFLKESEQIINKALNKKQPNLDQQSQEDFINVFEEFQRENQKENAIKNKATQSKQDIKQKEKQRQQRKREKSMKLIVKKNLPTQKQSIPEQFQINQHSLHQIERILFKNKKIVEDNIVFKKVKAKTVNAKLQKEREDFGKNWVYAYDMPYALQHEGSQDFIDYISKTYGNVIQYYIFPYKSMLEKRENIMLHVQNEKRLRTQQLHQTLSVAKQLKPSVADKLLQKIQKEKNLKLNKSSMVFKFRTHQAKESFLQSEMRLYGINYKLFRNIRFEQAQSKKIIAISMIPWGCSSQDLLKAINKALKPIQVQVSYQSCILAKGFIFIQFDNFYEGLNACNLLNNLQFQGHNLKVQINYGSSKLYGAKYKNSLQFDHYETLVKKLKEIKCFYNEVYQD